MLITVECACKFLYWCKRFGVLRDWAGVCEVNFFPGDNPDSALVDRKRYVIGMVNSGGILMFGGANCRDVSG